MKIVVVMLSLFLLLLGCTPTKTAVKDSPDPQYSNPAGTFGSQAGGVKVEMQATRIRYYLDPPLNVSETPLAQVLQVIFAKAGARYVIEGSLMDVGTPVFLTIERREELDDILRIILTPKAVKFEIDNNNVYHLKMNLIPLGK